MLAAYLPRMRKSNLEGKDCGLFWSPAISHFRMLGLVDIRIIMLFDS